MTQATAKRGNGQAPSARRRAREFALQALYAWLVQSSAPQVSTDSVGAIEAHVRDDPEFAQADQKWFSILWRGTTDNADKLRDLFVPFIDRPVQELSPVEHGILLIGTYELMNQLDVPYRVAINEAVELAKSFGGTDGFKFINGVLDKVAAQARELEVARAAQAR
jgi:N utilization substance protein B